MSDEPIVVLVDGDLRDLVPGFMGRRRDDVVKMSEALEREDLESLRVTGHTLKGTGGGYGFTGLSEIGALIEAAAVAEDTAALREHLSALEDYLSRVETRFQ